MFECFDTAGNTDSVKPTYKEEKGTRIFYDGDIKIGTRGHAIDYASEKTGGMICYSGTDRNS